MRGGEASQFLRLTSWISSDMIDFLAGNTRDGRASACSVLSRARDRVVALLHRTSQEIRGNNARPSALTTPELRLGDIVRAEAIKPDADQSRSRN